MNAAACRKDLVVLTADKDAEFAVRGILSRHKALGIRSVSADFFRHPEKDPGIRCRAHTFLQPFVASHAHALVVMDREGCGQEQLGREILESRIEEALQDAGWADRVAAVVPDPELEIWVWSDSPQVDAVLGWTGRNPDLRAWLLSSGYVCKGAAKPDRPKEAMEEAMHMARQPWSSAIFEQLARKVSLSRCQDAAFLKLRDTLRRWFAKEGNS
jgi:hypothetical protein